jgi:hypothetical protein
VPWKSDVSSQNLFNYSTDFFNGLLWFQARRSRQNRPAWEKRED